MAVRRTKISSGSPWESTFGYSRAGLADVVRTRFFVTDFGDFDEIARAHREILGDIRPATSMVQASALIDPYYVLEIEADAVVG